MRAHRRERTDDLMRNWPPPRRTPTGARARVRCAPPRSGKPKSVRPRTGFACPAGRMRRTWRDADPARHLGPGGGPYGSFVGCFGVGHQHLRPDVDGLCVGGAKTPFVAPAMFSRRGSMVPALFRNRRWSDLAGLRTRAARRRRMDCRGPEGLDDRRAHIFPTTASLLRADGSDRARHPGLTMFFLDMTSPGVEVRPMGRGRQFRVQRSLISPACVFLTNSALVLVGDG